jgi:tight adherence protein B
LKSVARKEGTFLKTVLALLSFISVLLLSYQLLKLFMGRNDYMSRLSRYTSVEEVRDEKKKDTKRENGKVIGEVLSRGIDKVHFLDGYKKKVQAELTRAHLLLKAEEFIALGFILFCLAFSFTILVRGITTWPLALIMGILGWYLPTLVLKSKVKKRIKVLNEQLSDALTMMSNSLKAGYSFFQAVDMVVTELTGPISEEFTVLQKEINLGQNTEKALENMAARIQSEDLDLVVTAFIIQRQVGGNLAEVLDNITSTIRDRVKIKGDIKALTAQGRMSGWVISLLPLVLYFGIYMINPQMMSLLYKRPLGIAMIIGAAVMECIGIMFISKIVHIEI